MGREFFNGLAVIEWLSLLKEVHQDGRSCLDSTLWSVCVPVKAGGLQVFPEGDIPTSASLFGARARAGWDKGSLQDHPAATCPEGGLR